MKYVKTAHNVADLWEVTARDLKGLDAGAWSVGDVIIVPVGQKGEFANAIGKANNINAAQEYVEMLVGGGQAEPHVADSQEQTPEHFEDDYLSPYDLSVAFEKTKAREAALRDQVAVLEALDIQKSAELTSVKEALEKAGAETAKNRIKLSSLTASLEKRAKESTELQQTITTQKQAHNDELVRVREEVSALEQTIAELRASEAKNRAALEDMSVVSQQITDIENEPVKKNDAETKWSQIIEQHKSQTEKSAEIVKRYKAENTEALATIGSLKVAKQQALDEIAELKAANEELSSDLSQIQAQADDKDCNSGTALMVAQMQAEARQETIVKLKSELTIARADLSEQTTVIKDLQGEVVDLKAELKACDEAMSRLRADLRNTPEASTHTAQIIKSKDTESTLAVPSGEITIYHEFPPIPTRSRAKVRINRILMVLRTLVIVLAGALVFFGLSLLATMKANDVDVNYYAFEVLKAVLPFL